MRNKIIEEWLKLPSEDILPSMNKYLLKLSKEEREECVKELKASSLYSKLLERIVFDLYYRFGFWNKSLGKYEKIYNQMNKTLKDRAKHGLQKS